MNAQELRRILLSKWGCSYDIQLKRVKGRIFLQVMWKYLEQASFPLSEAEYMAHLERVCGYLIAWEAVEHFTVSVAKTRDRPRLGKAVNIPIHLGQRASEWILDSF